MSFTYDLTTKPEISKIRLIIGDTVDATTNPGQGVKPDGTNFTDEEINVFIPDDNSWWKAVSPLLRVLANLFAQEAKSITIRVYREEFGDKASMFRKLAEEWDNYSPSEDEEAYAFGAVAFNDTTGPKPYIEE